MEAVAAVPWCLKAQDTRLRRAFLSITRLRKGGASRLKAGVVSGTAGAGAALLLFLLDFLAGVAVMA